MNSIDCEITIFSYLFACFGIYWKMISQHAPRYQYNNIIIIIEKILLLVHYVSSPLHKIMFREQHEKHLYNQTSCWEWCKRFACQRTPLFYQSLKVGFNIYLDKIFRFYPKISIYTVFTRFMPHPRIVSHCGTIRRVLSLFLEMHWKYKYVELNQGSFTPQFKQPFFWVAVRNCCG